MGCPSHWYLMEKCSYVLGAGFRRTSQKEWDGAERDNLGNLGIPKRWAWNRDWGGVGLFVSDPRKRGEEDTGGEKASSEPVATISSWAQSWHNLLELSLGCIYLDVQTHWLKDALGGVNPLTFRLLLRGWDLEGKGPEADKWRVKERAWVCSLDHAWEPSVPALPGGLKEAVPGTDSVPLTCTERQWGREEGILLSHWHWPVCEFHLCGRHRS